MIRVLIERQLNQDVDEALQRTMREMRREAIHCPGYISGETMRLSSDPRHYVVIATWRSREDWEAWMKSKERARIDEQLKPFLGAPEKFTVLEPA